ncbi:MAG: N-acetyltransferase [Anaerolineae bacterium]
MASLPKLSDMRAEAPLASQVLIRSATAHDAPEIARIVNGYAELGKMLPRPLAAVYQFLRDFSVAELDGQVVGCAALSIFWGDLAEVRSLAVSEDYRGRGIGQRLVRYLLREAQSLGIPRVFALTYEVGFFEALGFRQIPRDTLPRKIWRDCINCVHFGHCNETALIIDIAPKPEEKDS